MVSRRSVGVVGRVDEAGRPSAGRRGVAGLRLRSPGATTAEEPSPWAEANALRGYAAAGGTGARAEVELSGRRPRGAGQRRLAVDFEGRRQDRSRCEDPRTAAANARLRSGTS